MGIATGADSSDHKLTSLTVNPQQDAKAADAQAPFGTPVEVLLR